MKVNFIEEILLVIRKFHNVLSYEMKRTRRSYVYQTEKNKN